MSASATKNLLGCLPKAAGRNLLVGAVVLVLSVLLGGPKIYISLTAAVIVFCLMLIPYIAITWWSIWALAKDKAKGILVTDGPYAFSRNPMYSAIIFILNPALAILFRSWLLLLACVPIYFFWRKYVKEEEKGALAAKFGASHAEYMKNVTRFFPNLRKINPFLFYSATGLAIFLISFVSLNLNAVYLRWVIFETKGEIVYDSPQTSSPEQNFPQYPNQIFPSSEPRNNRADYSAANDSVSIEKIGIRAPLVSASGTTQKELNNSLNQGVILYPGSAWPGQDGEVVLSGHSSVFPWVKTEYGQVFTLLDKLEPGDIVSLVYDHRQYDYQITSREVLTPDKVRISDTNQPVIKLVTCWPIGTALKRLVVYGELIK